MAITVVTNTPDDGSQVGAFSVLGSSADLTGCEELRAAATGKSHYVDTLKISVDTAMRVDIGEGETASAPTTVRHSVYLSANVPYVFVFRRAIELTVNTSLTVDASAAGNVRVAVEGYTK